MTKVSAREYLKKHPLKNNIKLIPSGDSGGGKDKVFYSQNQMGPVKSGEFDPFSLYFMEKAKLAGSILEIGCGYGFMTKEVLEQSDSSKEYYINDLDSQHLAFAIENIDKEKREGLFITPGFFPDEVNFSDNSLDIIGAICIIHFLTPEKIVESFEKLYKWLKPGGELVFVNASVFNKRCSRTEEMLKLSDNGQKWAGQVYNLKESGCLKDSDHFPNYFNFSVLSDYQELIEKIGFKVNKLEYFNWRKGSPEKSYLGGILAK